MEQAARTEKSTCKPDKQLIQSLPKDSIHTQAVCALSLDKHAGKPKDTWQKDRYPQAGFCKEALAEPRAPAEA